MLNQIFLLVRSILNTTCVLTIDREQASLILMQDFKYVQTPDKLHFSI